MRAQYLAAAMQHAKYEILPADGSYYGEIALCRGVHAQAATLEGCRAELAAVLEDWLSFRLSRHMPVPEIDGVELTAK